MVPLNTSHTGHGGPHDPDRQTRWVLSPNCSADSADSARARPPRLLHVASLPSPGNHAHPIEGLPPSDLHLQLLGKLKGTTNSTVKTNALPQIHPLSVTGPPPAQSRSRGAGGWPTQVGAPRKTPETPIRTRGDSHRCIFNCRGRNTSECIL